MLADAEIGNNVNGEVNGDVNDEVVETEAQAEDIEVTENVTPRDPEKRKMSTLTRLKQRVTGSSEKKGSEKKKKEKVRKCQLNAAKRILKGIKSFESAIFLEATLIL